MRPVRAFPPEKTSSIATTCKQRATCTGRGTAITMSDSDASSDPEDFEYIPEGDGGKSESEESVAGEEEEKRGVSTSTITTRSSQQTQTQTSSNTRRTRRRSRAMDDSKEGEQREEKEGEGEGEDEKGQREKKTRVDSLWESFKQDSAASLKKPGPLKEQPLGPVSSKDEAPKTETKMVKIRKTYDFAGDEVVVEQEVAADSREAQQSLSAPSTASVSSTQPTSAPGAGKPATDSAPGPALAGKKRSGISSVLQSLAKKPKLSTLEKSQLDWNKFKAEEGLEHELAQQRKDGYLERQDFLQRTDWRQYELERKERLKKFNRPN